MPQLLHIIRQLTAGQFAPVHLRDALVHRHGRRCLLRGAARLECQLCRVHRRQHVAAAALPVQYVHQHLRLRQPAAVQLHAAIHGAVSHCLAQSVQLLTAAIAPAAVGVLGAFDHLQLHGRVAQLRGQSVRAVLCGVPQVTALLFLEGSQADAVFREAHALHCVLKHQALPAVQIHQRHAALAAVR